MTDLDRVPNNNALYCPFVACHLQDRSTLIHSVSLRYSSLLPISNSQSNVKKLTAVCSVNILVRNKIWIEIHYWALVSTGSPILKLVFYLDNFIIAYIYVTHWWVNSVPYHLYYYQVSVNYRRSCLHQSEGILQEGYSEGFGRNVSRCTAPAERAISEKLSPPMH